MGRSITPRDFNSLRSTSVFAGVGGHFVEKGVALGVVPIVYRVVLVSYSYGDDGTIK